MNSPARAALLALPLAAVAWVAAGPLNPPAGPVAPSYKTLAEIEPRIAINATNTPGDADSVFRIGGGASFYLTASISVPAGKSGIEVAGGSADIDLNGFTISGLPGSLDGIAMGNAVRVTVRNGVISNLAGAGVSSTGSNCTLRDLKINFCGSDGIRAGSQTVVESCNAADNTGAGIVVGTGCRVQGCQAYSNFGDGFTIGPGSLAIHCIARGSQAVGFNLIGDGAIVEACDAERSIAEGFLLDGSDCQALRCTARSNGFGAGIAAGIRVANPGCVVDGNSVSANDTGILVDVANSGTLVIRNRAHGNTTEYSIPAGNLTGPIVTNATIGASTNPHANYDQ